MKENAAGIKHSLVVRYENRALKELGPQGV